MKFRGLNSAVLTVIPKKSGKKPKRQKKKPTIRKATKVKKKVIRRSAPRGGKTHKKKSPKRLKNKVYSYFQ